jgi:hypothetical protein
MKSKDFALQIAGTIFGMVALLHLLRVITEATVVIAGWSMPIWVNVLGFIATAFLSAALLWLSLDKAIK